MGELSDDLGIRLVTDEEAERARAHIEALLADVASITPTERAERASQLLDADLLPAACGLAAHEPAYWDAALLRSSGAGDGARVRRARGRHQATAHRRGRAHQPRATRHRARGLASPGGLVRPALGHLRARYDGKPTQVSRCRSSRSADLSTPTPSEHYARLTWPAWLAGGTTGSSGCRASRMRGRCCPAVSAQSGGIHTQNAATMSRFFSTRRAQRGDDARRARALALWTGLGRVPPRLHEWFGDSGTRSPCRSPHGRGGADRSKSLSPSGNLGGWLDAVDVDAPRPTPRRVCLGRLGPGRALRHCSRMGARLERSETSTGKTTILRAAASVWGAPSDGAVLQSWNTTKARGELALFLKNCRSSSTTARTRGIRATSPRCCISIARASPRERARPGEGSQGIGLRRSAQWCSVMLSTGEQPAVSFTEDASRARCLSLTGPPMSSDAEGALGDAWRVLENHGHLGRRVLEHLVGNLARVQSLYALRLIHYVDELVEAGPVAARLAGLLALLDVARDLVEAVGYPSRPGVMSRAIAAARAGAREADRPREALRAPCSSIVPRTRPASTGGTRPTGRASRITPARGWLGALARRPGASLGGKVAVFERVCA